MRHKHHIVPRHAGGHDGPIAILTPAEHAEAHWILWYTHKRWQDYYAACGLDGYLGKEDIIKAALQRGGSKGGKTAGPISGPLTGGIAFKRLAASKSDRFYANQRNAGKAGVGECKAKGSRVSNKSRAPAYVNSYGIIFEGANEAAAFYAVHPCRIRGNPSRFNLTVIRK